MERPGCAKAWRNTAPVYPISADSSSWSRISIPATNGVHYADHPRVLGKLE